MKIIDITGPIYEGMWNFGFPCGQFKILQLNFDFLGHQYFHEGFEGFVGNTGTCIETGATYNGYKNSISTHEIPLEKLINIDAYVLQIPLEKLKDKDNRKYITAEDIKNAEKENIPENIAIIVSTGYGRNWDKKDYIEKSPFFKKGAIELLLHKKPIILCSDFPSWDNVLHPENNFDELFSTDTLVLANCINLEKIKKYRVKLIALPIKILDICICPARAVVIEE